MLMDKHAIDALVIGYEDLIPGLQLPDPNDRHASGAAIHGQANVIVTMNLRDFPSDVVAPFGIELKRSTPTNSSYISLTSRLTRLSLPRKIIVKVLRIPQRRCPSIWKLLKGRA